MPILEYGTPITFAEARRVADAAFAEAQRNGWAMVIAVYDSTGHPVLLHKMDHAQYASLDLAQAKARTATHFKRPTKVFEEAITQGGMALRLLSATGICLFEGGLPLLRDGRLVGGIGVSGATSEQDTQVAQAGARALEA